MGSEIFPCDERFRARERRWGHFGLEMMTKDWRTNKRNGARVDPPSDRRCVYLWAFLCGIKKRGLGDHVRGHRVRREGRKDREGEAT
jgi:hypothetical protein